MTFKLTPNPTFKTPVELTVPEMKGTATIEVEFKYKNKTELDTWFKSTKSTLDALDAIIVSWEGPLDKEDKPAPYTKAALKEMLSNYPKSGQELTTAFFNALTESRAKN